MIAQQHTNPDRLREIIGGPSWLNQDLTTLVGNYITGYLPQPTHPPKYSTCCLIPMPTLFR